MLQKSIGLFWDSNAFQSKLSKFSTPTLWLQTLSGRMVRTAIIRPCQNLQNPCKREEIHVSICTSFRDHTPSPRKKMQEASTKSLDLSSNFCLTCSFSLSKSAVCSWNRRQFRNFKLHRVANERFFRERSPNKPLLYRKFLAPLSRAISHVQLSFLFFFSSV